MLAVGLRALAGLIVAFGVGAAAHSAPLPLSATRQQPEAVRQAGRTAQVLFDMPRQPLQPALEQFHKLTGQSLLYDSAIVKGKMASPVRGRFTPEAALRSLLAGTGIVARYTSDNAFILVRPSSMERKNQKRPGVPATRASAQKRAYFSQIQGSVQLALCDDPATRPGAYRLALSLWVGANRRVDRVALHPTGNNRRDERIRELLTGLPVAALPPADVEQPITVLILPRPLGQSGDCATVEGGS